MMKSRSFLKNSSIYLGSSVINKAIPLLLLPVMTKYLTPEEYGILSLYLMFITFLSAFVGMNLHINVTRNYFKVERNVLASYIGNVLIILVFSFLFYFLVFYLISLHWNELFSIPTKVLLFVPVISAMSMVYTLGTTVLRNEQRAVLYGIFEISNTLIKLTITLIFLVFFGLGWYSQVVGIFSSMVVFMFVSLWYLFKHNYLNFKLNKKKIRGILSISTPMIPHVVGGVVIALSDRIFIERMVGIEAVGVYSVGYMFGMIVMIFTDSFIKAWSPWFYQKLASPNEAIKQQIVKSTYVYIVGVFVVAILTSLVSGFLLPYFVDEKFLGAQEFIIWVSIGYAARGVYQIFFPYLVHLGRTSFLAVITVVSASINLALNYVFIKCFGAIGAAYATLFSFIVSAALVFWYQRKYMAMPWLFLKVLK